MLVALTRNVSPSIERCELTHVDRRPIDFELARTQHRKYVECLSHCADQVLELQAAPELPDSVFVEDIAVVLDEIAIITRPGAEVRRRERPTIRDALRPYRALEAIGFPGTLDGGDVLRIGRTIYVGRSTRTNRDGIEQLRELSQPLGYSVIAVEVHGCLHLKSAVSQVAPKILLINRDWVDLSCFGEFEMIDVDPGEPFGANALLVDESVIYPALFPRTRARVEAAGLAVQTVEVGELAKAEGGVTCCSLLFEE
jgi:dimethylargininase